MLWQILEERRAAVHPNLRGAVLAFPGARHLAAKLVGEHLHAIANAEHRHPGLEQGAIGERRALLIHAGRPAGEDDRLRRAGADPLPWHRPIDQLAVDAGLTHPASDQLAILRAEVEDEHELLYPLPTLWGRKIRPHV